MFTFLSEEAVAKILPFGEKTKSLTVALFYKRKSLFQVIEFCHSSGPTNNLRERG